MKSELTDKEVRSLLDEARAVFPSSDFVASVEDWFTEHGFITEAQEEELNKIAELDW